MRALYYISGYVYLPGFPAGAVTFLAARFPVKCLYGEWPVDELATEAARFMEDICECEERTPPAPFS